CSNRQLERLTCKGGCVRWRTPSLAEGHTARPDSPVWRTMTAFEQTSLWSKSKVFIDRAMKARDNNDPLDFYLSSVIPLNLLGKAALSAIHPSLIADPQHFDSLLAACGRGAPIGVKSITAKTLYDRLHRVLPGFDEKMMRESMLMAERRNAELHS